MSSGGEGNDVRGVELRRAGQERQCGEVEPAKLGIGLDGREMKDQSRRRTNMPGDEKQMETTTQLHQKRPRGKKSMGAARLRNKPLGAIYRGTQRRVRKGAAPINERRRLVGQIEEAVVQRLGDGVGDQVVVQDVVVVAEIVARATTVDLGVAGNPIVVGDLSPADYANLVFNVVPDLPRVHGHDRW